MYCIDLTVQQTWHIYGVTLAGRWKPLDLVGIGQALVTVLFAKGRNPVIGPERPRSRMEVFSKKESMAISNLSNLME